MALWQKIGWIGIAACGVLLLILVFGGFPRHVPPTATANPWNASAIGSAFSGVRVKEIDPTHAAVLFFYDLDNKTDTDYHLANGPDVVVMSRLDHGGSLVSDQQVSLDSAAFVPARNRTRIAVEMTRPFDWPKARDAATESKLRQFVAAQTTGVEGFVVFDRAVRYQIEMPVASPQLDSTSPAAVRN